MQYDIYLEGNEYAWLPISVLSHTIQMQNLCFLPDVNLK